LVTLVNKHLYFQGKITVKFLENFSKKLLKTLKIELFL